MRDPGRRMKESFAFPAGVHHVADARNCETAFGYVSSNHHETAAVADGFPNYVIGER